MNFAAETHVDRSILDAGAFVTTDVYGSYVLLELVKELGLPRALFVSTNEVYGAVPKGAARESAPLAPRSPYAASKVGGELLVHAYHVTHGLPVLVTRGANTFGPYHYPEKLIPLMITNAEVVAHAGWGGTSSRPADRRALPFLSREGGSARSTKTWTRPIKRA